MAEIQKREIAPLQGAQLVVGAIAVSMATFMNVLDVSIANVSLPAIAGDLGVSPHQGTWVITSFAVSNAISIPLTGWLAQRFGQVRLFLSAVVLFVLASLLCGMAQSMEMLIAARVLQGAVAGPMVPMSQSLLLASFPRAKAGVAMAVWSMTALVAPITGPILGGWISDNYSWPWIFFINVPCGLIVASIIWRIYRTRETETQKLPVDRVGVALLVLWIAAIQLVLDKGRELNWFESSEIVSLAIASFVGLVFFIIWELNTRHPVVDLALFKRRNFLAGVVTISIGYGTFFGALVILPLWLQTQVGYTATTAGLTMAPVGLVAFFISPLIAKYIHRMDVRYIATFGFIVFSLAMYIRSHFTLDPDMEAVLIPAYIQGIAVATFFIPVNLLMFSGLEPEDIPAASGLGNFLRLLFGGFGGSIATTMWDNRAAMHHARLTEEANAFNPHYTQYLDQLGNAGFSELQAATVFEHNLSLQASTMGVNDIFWLSAVIFIALIAIIWMAKPETSTEANMPQDAH